MLPPLGGNVDCVSPLGINSSCFNLPLDDFVLGLWWPPEPPNANDDVFLSLSRFESLLDDDDDDDEDEDEDEEDLAFDCPESVVLLDGELAADFRADMLGLPVLAELPCFGDDVPCFGLTLAGTGVCFGLLL